MKIRELAVPDAYEVTPGAARRRPRRLPRVVQGRRSSRDAVGHRLDLRAGQHARSAPGAACAASTSPTSRPARRSTSPARRARCSTSSSTSGSARRPSAGGTRCCSTTTDRRAVYVGEGLGHVFMALTDGAVISYLCSAGYDPGREHGVHPLDPAIGIDWPAGRRAAALAQGRGRPDAGRGRGAPGCCRRTTSARLLHAARARRLTLDAAPTGASSTLSTWVRSIGTLVARPSVGGRPATARRAPVQPSGATTVRSSVGVLSIACGHDVVAEVHPVALTHGGVLDHVLPGELAEPSGGSMTAALA